MIPEIHLWPTQTHTHILIYIILSTYITHSCMYTYIHITHTIMYVCAWTHRHITHTCTHACIHIAHMHIAIIHAHADTHVILTDPPKRRNIYHMWGASARTRASGDAEGRKVVARACISRQGKE